MSSRRNRIAEAVKCPVRLTESVLVASLFVFGIYLVISALHSATVAVGGATTISDSLVQALMSLVCLVPACLYLTGTKSPRIRRWSVFCISAGYMFLALFRGLYSGFVPLSWLFPLALSFIAAGMYIYRTGRDDV